MIIIIYYTYKGINSINFLKRKLQYSTNKLQYIPILRIKIRMMKNYIKSIYFFIILYILTILIHKFLFLKYDTQKFEEFFDIDY